MPAATDFRRRAFSIATINASGRDVGRHVYWKLYAIENLVRVVVHSVLSVQIPGGNWWTAVDQGLQSKVAGFRGQYANQPWHSTPGRHEVYYTFLSDLNAIITAHSHLFRPTIPDIDQWIARIEQIRLPRNIVGHMNWPSSTDRQRIDVFYQDFQALIKKLASANFSFVIP